MRPHLVSSLFILSAIFAASPSRAGKPTLPEEDEHPRVSRKDAVEAYVKDCRATFDKVAWRMDVETRVSECQDYDTYQSCSPDYFGCSAGYISCQSDCARPCSGCQTSCADTCDGCRAACKSGDSACIRKCAEARADCREGCLGALKQCQGPACEAASKACVKGGVERLKSCNPEACNQQADCISEAVDEAAYQACLQFTAKESEFCQQICRIGFGFPSEGEFSFDGDTDADPEKALLAACSKKAQCPEDYAAALPYLTSFCGGFFNDTSMEGLKNAVSNKRISKKTLGMIFNVYGAMYGYEFKKETWLNAFFYGSGEWLPPTCKTRIKSVKAAKSMPIRMTKLRDQVKKLWNETK
jgi:hypothetical protein